MTKKWMIAITVTILMVSMVVTPGSFAQSIQNEVRIFLNDQEIQFPDVKPRIDSNNRILIPIRFVSEALGARVDFASPFVRIQQYGKFIQLEVGSNLAMIDGQEIQLDTKAIIVDGRTLVPLRFVSEALEQIVEWDGVNRTVWVKQKPALERELKSIEEVEVNDARDILPSLAVDDFRPLYRNDFYSERLHQFEDARVFSDEHLPIKFVDRYREGVYDTYIYDIWTDVHEFGPIIKIHYSGLHLGMYFLTEDSVPRHRGNVKQFLEEHEDGSYTATFFLHDPGDGYRNGIENWEDFQYEDILYIGFKMDSQSLPLYEANFK